MYFELSELFIKIGLSVRDGYTLIDALKFLQFNGDISKECANHLDSLSQHIYDEICDSISDEVFRKGYAKKEEELEWEEEND